MYIWLCISVMTYIYSIYIYIYICTYVYIYMYIYIYIYKYKIYIIYTKYIRIYIYIYMYCIYVDTRLHIYTYTDKLMCIHTDVPNRPYHCTWRHQTNSLPHVTRCISRQRGMSCRPRSKNSATRRGQNGGKFHTLLIGCFVETKNQQLPTGYVNSLLLKMAQSK